MTVAFDQTEAVERPVLPEQILGGGVVAIARGLPAGSAPTVAAALMRGGVAAFEVTLNSDEALSEIATLVKRYAEQELLVGAGTVLDVGAAARAVDAGARFLVTPHTDPALLAWSAAGGVPMLAGAFTPSEVMAAWGAGAAAIKLFPASVTGPAFVRECRGPFPHIPLIPTGGVDGDLAADFVRAGAVAVGLGGWLMGDCQAAGVEERARRAVSAIAAARRERSASSGEARS